MAMPLTAAAWLLGGCAAFGTHSAIRPVSPSPTAGASAAPVPSPVAVTNTASPYSCGPLAFRWTYPPGTAPAVATSTAVLGSVSATLTGRPDSGQLAAPHLLIQGEQGTLLSTTVKPPANSLGGAPRGVIPWSIGEPAQGMDPDSDASGALCVARFAGQSSPVVLLGLYLGGAHCCTIVRAYAPSDGAMAPPVDDGRQPWRLAANRW